MTNIPYDLNSLQENVKCGNTFEYIFFWGHSSLYPLNESCFSQWFPSTFYVDAVRYPCAEHFMMAEKARLFNDSKTLKEILLTPDPKIAKSLGRQINHFSENVWEKNRFNIVIRGNLAKFSQNQNLKNVLLNTKNKIIVETSPVDKIWGIGLSDNDKKTLNPLLWKGQNLLGFALMVVRDKLN